MHHAAASHCCSAGTGGTTGTGGAAGASGWRGHSRGRGQRSGCWRRLRQCTSVVSLNIKAHPNDLEAPRTGTANARGTCMQHKAWQGRVARPGPSAAGGRRRAGKCYNIVTNPKQNELQYCNQSETKRSNIVT